MSLRFENKSQEQLDFCDVLIAQKISNINSRKDVNITRYFSYKDRFGESHFFNAVPIIAANMATSGTISFARILVKEQYMAALEKHIPAEDIIEFFDELTTLAKIQGMDEITYRARVFLSIGIKESLDTLKAVDEKFPLFGINFDVPNGTIPAAIDRLRELRQDFPNAFIIAKTVCSGDQVNYLYENGADVVGISVGSGAVCTTRLKTGVGRPILSAISDAADIAEFYLKNTGKVKYVLCDGGITCAGDICKALVAGADFIMIGSLFAATEEANDGEIIINNGKKYKQQYGMSSFIAQRKIFKASAEEMAYRTSEGRTKLIPCSGSVKELISDFNGGMRSCGTYINARGIEEFPTKGSFYKVRRQLNETLANCKDF